MRFEFIVNRSRERSHQAPDFSCSRYDVGGFQEATSIYRVRDFCARLMVIPGVYRLKIRNVESGAEWRIFDPVDTRNPEAAAANLEVRGSRRPKT